MEIEDMKDVFNRIAKTGALIVPPAYDDNIEKCNMDLRNIGLQGLPNEYAQFLKMSNGLAWNGFEFFGTFGVRKKSTGYILRDIVGFNENIEDMTGMKSNGCVLVLGRFDEDVYVYHYVEKEYRILDSLTFMIVEQFKDFNAFLLDTVAGYAYSMTGGEDEEDEEYEAPEPDGYV